MTKEPPVVEVPVPPPVPDSVAAVIDPYAPVVTGYDDGALGHHKKRKKSDPAPKVPTGAKDKDDSYMFRDRGWNFRSEVGVDGEGRVCVCICT